jgi:hypothetical protein
MWPVNRSGESSIGYGIARRIEQVAQGPLALNQGTIYPARDACAAALPVFRASRVEPVLAMRHE